MKAVRFAAVLLCFLFLSAEAWAERKALLIGNADYKAKRAELANPVRDVRLLSKALQEAGFRTTIVKNATELKLKKALNRFAESLTARDDAFVYYSGHGIAIDGKNYLLGVEFRATNPVDALARHSDIYPVNQLVKRLEVTRARLRVVVIDACRDEPFTKTRGWQTSKTSAEAYKGFEPVARTPVGRGTLVAFATAGKQQALDLFSKEVKNGPYAYALSQQIRTPGADILHVFTDLGAQVRQLTGNKQSPEFLSNIEGRFYFTAATEPPPNKNRKVAVGSNRKRPKNPLPAPRDMVNVSGGPFFMGCNQKLDAECDNEEMPGKMVNVKAFSIDRTEVTVEAYAACVEAGMCSKENLNRSDWGNDSYCNWGKKGREKHPVNCLSWYQAKKYCAWKRKRLPKEAEWEKAARGVDARKYPWGNQRVSCDYAVVDSCHGQTLPVGSKSAGGSPYGALDMVGNVREWVDGWEDNSARFFRVARGGSWFDDSADAQVLYRSSNPPEAQDSLVGFRCAR